MSRYIDLDSEDCVWCGNPGEYENWNIPLDMPGEDVVPVVHGHWIKIGSQDSIRNMKCSICGEEVFGDVDTEKYCFNCGAKMDEVKHGNN